MKRTPLSRISNRRRRVMVQRQGFVQDLLDGEPRCQVCYEQTAVDVHEPLTRARGGSVVDPDNAVVVCRSCHDWIHENPEQATRRGLLRSQHD